MGAGFTNLDAVILVIGISLISGYGEGGAISIEPVSDLWSSAVGGDGNPGYAKNNDKRRKGTLTLRADSRAFREIYDMILAQQASPAIFPIAFRFENPANGEIVTDDQVVFMNWPTVDAMKDKIGDREITFELPSPTVVSPALARN